MRLALVSDAWAPQVNGVVRTLTMLRDGLIARGVEVEMVTPDGFDTVPCPGYREIRLAVAPGRTMRRRLDSFAPTLVHVATEGPLGWAARRWAMREGVPLTTAFHTRFPDYLAVRTGLSAELFWPALRRFHGPGKAVLAATPGLVEELHARRVGRPFLWSRGVDLRLFTPAGPRHPAMADVPHPIQLNVGRVAVEKNLDAFLSLPTPGTKVVVGDGPALAALRRSYPEVLFLGAMTGAELAAAYRSADVFVFPSRTDTFGLVMIEALASGVPVAGYPVPGPLDVIGRDGLGPSGTWVQPVGALHPALDQAIAAALTCGGPGCVTAAADFSWDRCVTQFLEMASAASVPRDEAA